MTSPEDILSEPSADSGLCQPLLDVANPELFRTNAFRITGLQVDVSTREMAKHADKLKMMEELGDSKSLHQGAFAFTSPPTMDQIREAIQRLKDPEHRLIDEFFWFWPRKFGEGASDPALQAIAAGNADAALEIWLGLETDPAAGVTAVHNVAVLRHLMALEWENHNFESTSPSHTRRETDQYWHDAFKRWDLLVEDSQFWEVVRARVRQLDDARLSGAFVDRMQKTLPLAVHKINAEFAIRYAEENHEDLARHHVEFMRQVHEGLSKPETTADLVLAPARARLRQQIDQAQKRIADPVDAPEPVSELLTQAKHSFVLFDLLLGENSEAKGELAEETANVSNRLLIAYNKQFNDHQSTLDLLAKALPFARSNELRVQIEDNIRIIRGNLAFKKIETHVNGLRAIGESKDSISVKIEKTKAEAKSVLDELIRKEGAASVNVSELNDQVALAFRSISIDAYNQFDDVGTALQVIELAASHARDPELKKKIDDDRAQLLRNKAEFEKHDLDLKIRSDSVVVRSDRFRYNSTEFPAKDINGIRFGIFIQYTNGAKSSVSYKIGLSCAGRGSVTIECKRFFRAEAKAEADYNAILQSLDFHILPSLTKRLAQRIADGDRIPLGNCWMTKGGIEATTGLWFWKKQHLVSWTDVRFGINAGYLSLSSATDSKFKKTFSLRETWNAVLFKQIANAVVTLLNL